MKYLLIIGLLLGCERCFAQKKTIKESDIDNWPAISGQKISNDGEFVLYGIYTYSHSPVWTIQAVDNSWKIHISGAENPIFNADSKKMIYRVADTLCVLNLVTKHISHYLCHGPFAIPSDGSGEWLAYVNNSQDSLIIRNLWTDRAISYAGLTQFQFNRDGSTLIAASHKEHIANSVVLINLNSGKLTTILNDDAYFSDFAFDPHSKKIAFVETQTINNYTLSIIRWFNVGMDTCRILTSRQSTKEEGLVSFRRLKFSKDGLKIFFDALVSPRTNVKQMGASVDVWSYKDTMLQSMQAYRGTWPESYFEVVGLNDQQVIRLGDEERDLILLPDSGNCNYVLKIQNLKNITGERNPDIFQKATIYVVSTQDGAQKQVISGLYSTNASGGAYAFSISPEGKYFLWYDTNSKTYNTLNISSGVIKNLSSKINTSLYDGEDDHPSVPLTYDYYNPFIWGPKDSFVLINDRYDIWKVDPEDKAAPANLTNGYGRKHHQVFRYVDFNIDRGSGYGGTISSSDKLLLVAFDTQSKYNGFFNVQFGGGDPQKLTMGPYVYYFNSPISSSDVNFFNRPIKAKSAERYLVTRMGPQEYPNLYITTGFKKMDPMTNLSPQSEYNWYSCELIHWKTFDNKESAGILYKPEDFDPTKKYPVIFYYYEKLSDGLYQYLKPRLCAGELDIPSYVSNGYLVFVPDIHYNIGSPGESAYNSIVSAANYLSKFPWVDSNKMGLQGHSFGGYETNYIITKTSRFAAAAPAAGPVDLISGYGSLRGSGESAEWLFEYSQFRLEATLWQNPQSYLNNSPIFNADKVKTPLLIMHNKNDGAVPFDQGIEWFTALRRLSKKVWLLQYDGEGHTLNKKENELDFTIRLRQFFDHYLKNAPAPKWMTRGISFQNKGVDDGLALDQSGIKP